MRFSGRYHRTTCALLVAAAGPAFAQSMSSPGASAPVIGQAIGDVVGGNGGSAFYYNKIAYQYAVTSDGKRSPATSRVRAQGCVSNGGSDRSIVACLSQNGWQRANGT